jgi:DNA-binding XRE family transcriptional regulator
MKRLPRIIKITSITDFVVQTLWNNGELREIDFKPMLAGWKAQKEEMYEPLQNREVFEMIAVSADHTLYWPNLSTKITFNGVTKEAHLDLDPDVLYNRSTLVSGYEHSHIGKLLKAARLKAGLSQQEVAMNSGTSRTYISRIENEHSDIQFDVFYKIVRLGIGMDLKVSIE